MFASRNTYHHSSRHCPGEPQASVVRAKAEIMPKLGGLKKRLSPVWKTNFLPIVVPAVKAMVVQ